MEMRDAMEDLETVPLAMSLTMELFFCKIYPMFQEKMEMSLLAPLTKDNITFPLILKFMD